MVKATSKIGQTRIVEKYLASLHAKDDGSRFHSQDWLEKKIKDLQEVVKDASLTWTQRLLKTQQLRNYEWELEQVVNAEPVEAEFLTIVLPWSQEKGVEVETWQELGVPMKVLKEAGF